MAKLGLAADGVPDKREAKGPKTPSHATRLEWFEDWEDQQRQNRIEARIDRDYYDGKQWTPDELRELKKRGQPPTVNNRIAKKINTLLGEEIEKRINPNAKPRTPQHQDDSRAMTDALRFVADEQRFDEVRSAVAKNVFIEGIGGAVKRLTLIEEDGVVVDAKHALEHQEYDRLFYDPHSRAHDFGDALYKGLVVWKDIDDAIALFPDAAEMLEQALSEAEGGESTDDVPRQWVDKKRQRVKIIEMYFRQGDDWWQSFFTKAGDLEDASRCAYVDDDGVAVCPLEMESGYIDADGNRYGVVRNLRSPQDAINKRESKSLHLLSVDQTMAEQGTVLQPEEMRQERAKPDGFYDGFAPGALVNGAVQFNKNLDLAQGHVMLLQEAKANIDNIGPSASNLPELPTGASGVAIARRRKAAALDYGTLFDQLRSWSRRIFTLDAYCIKQTWTEEKWLRVGDDKQLSGYRFVALNRKMTRAQRLAELLEKEPKPPVPDAVEIAAGMYAPIILAAAQQQAQALAQQAKATGQQAQPGQILLAVIQQHPLMQEVVTTNQVAKTLVDIVIDEAPDTAVLAEEQFATLSEMMMPIVQAKPDLAPALAKMLVMASTLPDKREVAALFDKAPDPAQAQMQQQLQKMQQQMMALEAQLKAAQVQKTTADAQLSQARAQSEMASIGQTEAPQQVSSLETAKAEREQVNTQLDVEKTRAQVEKERAGAAKLTAEAASTAHQMTQPEIVEVAIE